MRHSKSHFRPPTRTSRIALSPYFLDDVTFTRAEILRQRRS